MSKKNISKAQSGRKVIFLAAVAAAIFFVTYITAKLYSENPNKLYSLNIEGVIDPVIADYVSQGIDEAEFNKARAVLIIMDTPGGLLESTRKIIQKMLNTDIPVIVYVYPKGARAASAGVFITMASDIAAMAPLTHIGAAHPVSMGGMPGQGGEKGVGEQDKNDKDSGKDVMEEKILSDTLAYMENLAKEKGRNQEWALKAVKESVSVTSTDALELKVIEYIAEDVDALLNVIGEKTLTKNGNTVTLDLKNALRVEFPLSAIKKFLHAIANPNIAYMLLIIGFYGLIYEFSSPGIGLGAVMGSICLIMAFYSLQMLPVNYVGLILILLGFIMLILEIKIASHGILSIGGIVSFILGSFFLIDSSAKYLKISGSVIAGVSVATLLFFGYALKKVLDVRSKKPSTGREGIIGEAGIVKEAVDVQKEGLVFVHGELWSAVSDGICEVDSKVVVTDVKDGKLKVKKTN